MGFCLFRACDSQMFDLDVPTKLVHALTSSQTCQQDFDPNTSVCEMSSSDEQHLDCVGASLTVNLSCILDNLALMMSKVRLWARACPQAEERLLQLLGRHVVCLYDSQDHEHRSILLWLPLRGFVAKENDCVSQDCRRPI